MKKYLPLLLCLALATPAFAEEAKPAPANTAPAAAPGEPFVGSFLFSPAEVGMIQQANTGKLPGLAMLEAENPKTQSAPVIPARRLIILSGVVYRSDSDWVAWINGKRVTPRELLPEIIDISVKEDSVRLKWFDIGINNVISISLKPHQTYDIVTGVLLPG
jgi:hypothetical protein